jgi:hypothetical protein
VESDVYSLGKVLQAMALGRHPLPGQDQPAGDFRTAIRRATRPDPSDRYHSVQDFLKDVDRVARGPARWEDPSETLQRISEDLTHREMDLSLLDQLMSMAEASDPPLDGLTNAMVELSELAIRHLWASDHERFVRAFDLFCQAISTQSFQFAFCDPLANFVDLVIQTTDDDEILQLGVKGLARLGESHNRFHVRSVLTSVLQAIRSSDRALAALEGLREAGRATVEWNVSEFTVRSLHPTLRDGIWEILPTPPDELPPGEVYS